MKILITDRYTDITNSRYPCIQVQGGYVNTNNRLLKTYYIHVYDITNNRLIKTHYIHVSRFKEDMKIRITDGYNKLTISVYPGSMRIGKY